MEPPVSDPSDTGTKPAATAAALPPELPPGTRSTSHGLKVGPKAEVSVEPPKAFEEHVVCVPVRFRLSL